MSLASGHARAFRGHDGMREVWAESRANWVRFSFSVIAERDGVIEVNFSGLDTVGGPEHTGALWFRAEGNDGRIVRLWSALDAGLLPGR